MDQDGIVVNASDFHSSNPRSFSGRRKHNLLFKVAVNLLLENNEVEGVGGRGGGVWGETECITFFCNLESSNYWWVGGGRLG